MLMETETMLPADLAPVAAPALTPWGMYLAADVVVKAVMIALALASLATWTILLAKGWELTRQARQLRAARALLLQSAQLPPQSEEASLQQGIAEALLATALGLVAAIPAVLVYNHFSRVLAGLRGLLGDLSAAVQQLVSRDLDRVVPRSAAAPLRAVH